MRLTLPDVARIFGVTENSVRKWVAEDAMPCDVFDDRFRFNRSEVLEWATLRRVAVSPAVYESFGGDGTSEQTLFEALERGGIRYDLKAGDKQTLLRAVVEDLPLPATVDRDVLYQLFLSRELLGTTAIEDGIAVPHPRRPVILDVGQPVVRLYFLADPMDFQAADGKPVRTLFALVAPTVHDHLRLLARLAAVLQDRDLRQALADSAPRAAVLAAVARSEAALDGRERGVA